MQYLRPTKKLFIVRNSNLNGYPIFDLASLPPRGIWQCLEIFSVVTAGEGVGGEMLLAFSEQRSRTPLNILQDAEQLPTIKIFQPRMKTLK